MPVDDTPLDQLGREPVEMPIGDKTYRIPLVEWGDFEAFEAHLRGQRLTELQKVLPSVDMEPGDKARFLSGLLAAPFTIQDVMDNANTLSGARWIIERLMGKVEPDFQVGAMGVGELMQLLDAIMTRSGLKGGEGDENPPASTAGGG
ncbi:MAG: hypothetical protein E3J64_09050 [Anaerolineales bacterium]|nr:MAG: hypothetical protein E3J64_09050 [Anaerolineales bacterium]